MSKVNSFAVVESDIEKALSKMPKVSEMTEEQVYEEFWRIQSDFDRNWTVEMYEGNQHEFERDVMLARQRVLDDAHKELTGRSLV